MGQTPENSESIVIETSVHAALVGLTGGAALMSLSTVIVAANAQLLRRLDLGRLE
mgnify:CR=1 FL=1